MRKGFNSSRGAIRGTIGGAGTVRPGTGGFATVAISFGPFRCVDFPTRVLPGLTSFVHSKTALPNRLRQTFSYPPDTCRDMRPSRSAESLRLHGAAETNPRPHPCRKRDPAPVSAIAPRSAHPPWVSPGLLLVPFSPQCAAE